MADHDLTLDIVIPVYNEGEAIGGVLAALHAHVRTPFRVLICYDHDEDTTLAALRANPPPVAWEPVKNRGRGAWGAVVTGFAHSRAPAVLVFPADDDYNAARLDGMVEAMARTGADIVCASRFIPGGTMQGCPWLKAFIVRSSAAALHHLARLPTHDPSNGFRLFSQRLLRRLPLESTEGFTYSIELLVKAHRLGCRITEVPVHWYERKSGQSRFKVVRWLPAYFRWFRYAFATTWLGRGAESVRQNVIQAAPHA